MTAVDDLVGELDDFPVVEAPDGEEAARLADLDQAVRVARSLRAVELRRREIQAAADAEIDRIREWAARADRPLATRAEYLEMLLQQFALAERAAGRGKSLTTPYARVATREVAGRWVVSGEALEWAEVHRPDLVKVTRSLPVSEVRGALTVTPEGVVDPSSGELVPGVTVEPGRVTATVTVDLDGLVVSRG